MFAGVGGICLAFEQSGCKVVWANELDKNACKTYRLNFVNNNLIESDIYKIEANSIPDCDILVGGFPCQSFSLAGNQMGLKDNRGNLFFEIIRVLKYKKPQCVMLENVKNLLSVNNGMDYEVIKKSLEEIGYHIKSDVLGSYTHANIPQSRERLFIVGFLSESSYDKFHFPPTIPLKTSLDCIINRNDKKPDKYYYKEPSQYYNDLTENVIDDKVYQIRRVYIRRNNTGLCPTLTANMGGGGHNVPIIKDDFGIRKLTPQECFLLQGFPKSWKIDVADVHAYKQAGNSVTVPLVKRIAKSIIKVL